MNASPLLWHPNRIRLTGVVSLFGLRLAPITIEKGGEQ